MGAEKLPTSIQMFSTPYSLILIIRGQRRRRASGESSLLQRRERIRMEIAFSSSSRWIETEIQRELLLSN